MIRYIQECKTEFMATKQTKDMIANLSNRKYIKLDHIRLSSPDFIKNEDLVDVILNSPKVSYDYLLNLSDYQKSQENLNKLIDDLNKLKCAKITYDDDRFPGASVWLEELDNLEKNIVAGMTTEWKYDKHNAYQY